MGFKTFVAGDVLTAADVNDYLMEQAVIACTSGTRPSSPNEGMTIYQTDTDTFAVYQGSAWCEITPESAVVATSETTTSTSFTDLTTAGPAVTLQTATKALVTVSCQLYNSGANTTVMGVAISGASTVAADDFFIVDIASAANKLQTASMTKLVTGLTAGANTFTAKYRVNAGTGTFLVRCLTVVGIP